MSTRRVYDVIVLGGHRGALVAAALLARKGQKVLHVEHEGLAGGYRDRGWTLPFGPELLPGPRSSPVVDHVLQALALTADVRRALRPLAPALQVVAPGHRFELAPEGPARRRELVREFGAAEGGALADRLDALMAADEALAPFLTALPPLPPDGFRARREVRRAARGVPLRETVELPAATHPVGAALRLARRLSGHLWTPEPSPLHAIRGTARLLRGVYRHAEAGSPEPGYARVLRRRMHDMGVEAAGTGHAPVEEILVEGGRVAGVRLRGDKTAYGCRHLVSGLDVETLRRLLPLGGRRRRYDSTLASVRPRQRLFTVHLVLDRAGWPAGLGEAAVVLSGRDGRLEEEHAMLVQRFDALGETGSDAARVVLQASCFTDAGPGDELAQLQDRLLAALRADLLPFLDRHLELVSAPDLVRRRPAAGEAWGIHPLLETEASPYLGVAGLAPSTPYRNLVLVGREVVPGLGIEGEFLAGWRGADLVVAAAHKHDPLRG